MFFDTFKHLVPQSRAWRLTANKNLRSFFEGLSGAPEDARYFVDDVFDDIDPGKTRQLTEWERQFGLPATLATDAERRVRLAAEWKATGGQSPRYIQDTLQAAGFPVFIHEWFVPGTNPPTVRDPRVYITDAAGFIQFESCDGADTAQDNDEEMEDGGALQPRGYVLVNKDEAPTTEQAGDGGGDWQDGDALAQDGSGVVIYRQRPYIIPSDPDAWPYFIYIGGETFPDFVTLPANRRAEFERLVLKICPAHIWAGILIDYS